VDPSLLPDPEVPEVPSLLPDPEVPEVPSLLPDPEVLVVLLRKVPEVLQVL
jgi:hypothetical protein